MEIMLKVIQSCNHLLSRHVNICLKKRSVCALSLVLPSSVTQYDIRFYSRSAHKHFKQKSNSYFLLSGITASVVVLWYLKKTRVFAEHYEDGFGREIPDLPTYSADEVAQHDSIEKRIWVCFKSGVYDITDFVDKHPGGESIFMAAGSSLEPFWELIAVHKTEQVLRLLETYRIGNLKKDDRGLHIADMEDLYAADPKRHSILKPCSVKPFNAEPPPELLVENFITPNEVFFVRNHLPVPDVDMEEYELEIVGIGIKKPIHLKLSDIKKFEKHTVMSTIHCAGNRRSEMNAVKEVKGLTWGSAAIGNAQWSGARLYDVLKWASLDLDDPRIQHVQFEGLDMDPTHMPYGASIPAEKALDPHSELILAYEMNGRPLPRDHGFPLRLVAPGVVGARNVKWLGRVVLSQEESKSHWQRDDYKGFSPSVDWETVDFSKSPAIQELPINSAICVPSGRSPVRPKDGHIVVKGYAWSGGGRKVVRVDVSGDGGKTWREAELVQDDSSLYRCWAWTLWKVMIPVEAGATEMELVCKAVDSSYNVQPDSFLPIWNLRGVLSNAWYRIRVKLQH